MLMLTLTYNGQKIRCTTSTKPLEHQWWGYVSKIDPIQVRSNQVYGGWLRVSQPTVSFTPELFDISIGQISDFPPPQQIQALIQGTGSNEASAVTLCSGVLALKSISETAIDYEMNSSPYIPTPALGQTLSLQYSSDNATFHNSYQDTDRFVRYSFNGGIIWSSGVQFIMPGGTSLASWGTTANLATGFFAKVCSVLGLTLDSSLASSANPAISGTVSGDTLLLDVADAVAAYFCHYFWIDPNNVLHLIDAASINGTTLALQGYDFVRGSKSTWQSPVNAAYDSAGKIAIVGNTLFGSRLNAGASYYGTDNTYLKKIASYSAQPQSEIALMDQYGAFLPGKVMTWFDDRAAQVLYGSMSMRAIQYDFGTSADKLTIIGEAVLT